MTRLVDSSRLVDAGPAGGPTLAVKVGNNDWESGVEVCECPNNGGGRYEASMRKGGMSRVGLGRLRVGLGGWTTPETVECFEDGGGDLSLSRSMIGA